jgi:hypothetical protein
VNNDQSEEYIEDYTRFLDIHDDSTVGEYGEPWRIDSKVEEKPRIYTAEGEVVCSWKRNQSRLNRRAVRCVNVFEGIEIRKPDRETEAIITLLRCKADDDRAGMYAALDELLGIIRAETKSFGSTEWDLFLESRSVTFIEWIKRVDSIPARIIQRAMSRNNLPGNLEVGLPRLTLGMLMNTRGCGQKLLEAIFVELEKMGIIPSP